MKLAWTLLLLFPSVPLARAQSLEDEFLNLKKSRDKAIQEATAPIDKKFAESANLLLAKAIQKGEMDAAATIRKSIPQGPAGPLQSGLDTFLETKSWSYHGPWYGGGDTVRFKTNGKIEPKSGSWERTGPNQIKVMLDNGDAFTFDYRSSEKCLFSQVKGKVRTYTVIDPGS